MLLFLYEFSEILFQAHSQNLRKATISFVLSVCLSAWNNSAPAGRIFTEFVVLVFFENLLRKSKFHSIMAKITGK